MVFFFRYIVVPNRAFHVRNSKTEEIVFIGGTLMDPDSVDGWHLLTDLSEHIGRIRITSDELAVGFARRRVIVFNLRNQMILGDEEFRREINVGTADAYNRALMFLPSALPFARDKLGNRWMLVLFGLLYSGGVMVGQVMNVV
ncbi:hypothetical protein HanOQP8_Chr02g0076731 [Helianthus annuus]|nr:hypothetical protein HanLR1_Chr02g0065821 [Helianthus annuus]KAJ0786917.1 hypothetical protein HanOQP8_Chr02g0076731 [Helianthus annuus]